jgi:hypothetical protein
MKSRSVFPLLKSENTTLMIFSYVDVHHRAVDFLKKLNSKGYHISQSNYNKEMFEEYLKSNLMCFNIKKFEEEELMFYPEACKGAKKMQRKYKCSDELENTI